MTARVVILSKGASMSEISTRKLLADVVRCTADDEREKGGAGARDGKVPHRQQTAIFKF